MNTKVMNKDLFSASYPVLGPLCMCLILSVASIPIALNPFSSFHWIFPLIAVVSLLLSSFYLWKGFVFALGITTITLSLQFYLFPAQWTWIVALSAAMVSALVLTVLCYDASSESLDSIRVKEEKNDQEINHLKTLLNQLSLEQQSWQQEKSYITKKQQELQEEFARVKDQCLSHEDLLSLARDEITFIHGENENLRKKMLEMRQQAHEQQNSKEIAHPYLSVGQQALQKMQEELQVKERAILGLSEKLALSQAQTEASEKLLAEHQQKIQSLNSSLKKSEDELQREKNHILESQAHVLDLQANQQSTLKVLAETQNLLQQLSIEKEHCQQQINQLEEQIKAKPLQMQSEAIDVSAASIDNYREMQRFKGLYQQLKEQFAHKSATLDAARRDLFCAQEKIAALQQEANENRLVMENSYAANLQKILADASSEIEELEASREESCHLHDLIHREFCQS